MRPIDAALEALADIAQNNGAVPGAWVEAVKDHPLSEEMGLFRIDLAVIAKVMRTIAPCKFLEIGAGSSTSLLFGQNPNGLNVSLEDSNEWVEKVRAMLPGGIGTVISYDNATIVNPNTPRTDWRAQIKKIAGYSEESVRMPPYLLQKRVLIPDWLWTIQFDVILVDGPFGFGPGRSGTIMLASKLAGPTSVVFVDDSVNRPHEMEKVETFFPDRYVHSFAGGKLTVLV